MNRFNPNLPLSFGIKLWRFEEDQFFYHPSGENPCVNDGMYMCSSSIGSRYTIWINLTSILDPAGTRTEYVTVSQAGGIGSRHALTRPALITWELYRDLDRMCPYAGSH
jgi:hypothetical protein